MWEGLSTGEKNILYLHLLGNNTKRKKHINCRKMKKETLILFILFAIMLSPLWAKAQKRNFVNVKSLSKSFVLDMRYATENNFLKQKLYPCPECFLREEVALALVEAQKDFEKMGYKIKIYDCYRPLSIQKKMWKILPGTNYVANPAKGSKHNKGVAVDLTLIDKNGKELDMGTEFDFFGKKAHHSYTALKKQVLENRKILRETLAKHGFKHIYSEWWHYEFKAMTKEKVEDFQWECK